MKSVKFNPLTSLVMAVALAIGLVGCGGGSDNDVMEAEPEPMPMPMPPMPMPEAASGEIMLTAEQHAALLGVLPDNGDSATLNVGADGVTRAGVMFTCVSDYDCTVTVSNSAGTLVAMWESQTLGDGTASAMATGLEPPVNAYALLNPGSTEAIRDLVGAQDGTTTEPMLTPTELVGMEIGGPGVLDASKAGLLGSLDPNTADAGGAATDPGVVPGLTGGSMLTGADHGFDASMSDIAPAPDGWVMKTLFRDWGDAAGDAGDGGFETGAIVVKNLGEGTPYPFDRKLSGKYVNPAAQAMFALSIRADGSLPGVTTLGTSVDIDSDTGATNTATSTQWAAMSFDSMSLVPAQDQDLEVNTSETFTGSYFDAPGQFRCIADADENCGLVRNDDGTVGVADSVAATMGIQGAGRWSFTPDPGAMITVPDQDWMAYGAWLTTPDDTGGTHRLGVFFNGMDPWAPAADSLTADNAAGLRGSATYSGGATGVYVDGVNSGLFTARAMLTADFDKASDGSDDADVDYMISGRIDDFRGTNGVALGADTGDMPNPQGRGENDWVVELNAIDFGETTDGALAAPDSGDGNTTGSADGVPWTGLWNGQFFGPTSNADGALAPSGVAGQFWAETMDANPEVDGDGLPVTAVVGAFGASKDD